MNEIDAILNFFFLKKKSPSTTQYFLVDGEGGGGPAPTIFPPVTPILGLAFLRVCYGSFLIFSFCLLHILFLFFPL